MGIRAQSAHFSARRRQHGDEHHTSELEKVSGNVHREKRGVHRQRRGRGGKASETTRVHKLSESTESDRNRRERSEDGEGTMGESRRNERERIRGGGAVRAGDVRVVLRRRDYRERWEFDRV